jgi:hypothetical protein
MKLLLIPFLSYLLLSGGTANGQAKLPLTEPCKGKPVGLQIGYWEAQYRQGLFKTKKWRILNKHAPGHPFGFEFKYKDFSDMLRKVIGTGRGVRIYFGAYKDSGTPADNVYGATHLNNLIPIFVPTTNDQNGYHRDDREYYIIRPGGYKEVLFNSAKVWVDNYQPIRNDLGAALGSAETKSIWFSYQSIFDWLEEIKCQIDIEHRPIDLMSIKWNVFSKDIPKPAGGVYNAKGRLTLLFDIPKARPLTKKQFQKFLQAYMNKHKDFVPYDTGVPCPPADNCEEGNSLYPEKR